MVRWSSTKRIVVIPITVNLSRLVEQLTEVRVRREEKRHTNHKQDFHKLDNDGDDSSNCIQLGRGKDETTVGRKSRRPVQSWQNEEASSRIQSDLWSCKSSPACSLASTNSIKLGLSFFSSHSVFANSTAARKEGLKTSSWRGSYLPPFLTISKMTGRARTAQSPT